MSEYLYVLILMKLWSGDFENNLERVTIKVDEYNRRAAGTAKGRIQKVQYFSSS